MYRTWKRVKSVCMNTNVSAIDDEFNQIMSVISARGDLLELPRNDESDSAVGAVDEPKYSVSTFYSLCKKIHFMLNL